MEFNQRLIYIMNHNNITPNDLSKTSGVSRAGINYILSGEKSPTISTLYKLCKALKVNIRMLFDYTLTKEEIYLLSLYSNADKKSCKAAILVLQKGQAS